MENQHLREAFAVLSTALVADACSHLGVLARIAPSGIRPLLPHQMVAGRVLPVRYFGGDGPVLEMIRIASPGDVLVVDNQGRADEGCIGELVALEAETAGVGGIIVWGAHRDTAALVSSGLPIFSYGSCPAKALRAEGPPPSAPASPQFGSSRVGRDDVVFADADGVVFVPDEALEELLRMAAAIADAERGRAEAIRAGVGLRSQLWLDDLLMSKSEGGPEGVSRQWGPAPVWAGAKRGGTHG